MEQKLLEILARDKAKEWEMPQDSTVVFSACELVHSVEKIHRKFARLDYEKRKKVIAILGNAIERGEISLGEELRETGLLRREFLHAMDIAGNPGLILRITETELFGLPGDEKLAEGLGLTFRYVTELEPRAMTPARLAEKRPRETAVIQSFSFDRE